MQSPEESHRTWPTTILDSVETRNHCSSSLTAPPGARRPMRVGWRFSGVRFGVPSKVGRSKDWSKGKWSNWVANKRLEISNFKFKFPRARNREIIRYYRQTLQGSFSAVSKPKFASKYSLESSRRDLHNALLCTVLESNPKN